MCVGFNFRFNARWRFQANILKFHFGLIANCNQYNKPSNSERINGSFQGVYLISIDNSSLGSNPTFPNSSKLSFLTNLISIYYSDFIAGAKTL